MTKHLFAVVLSVAVFAVPLTTFAQLGTAANPIYIQDLTPPDPFANLNRQIQQQQILNAMNAQTQAVQQAALQQTISNLKAQYGYSAYASCASRGGGVCNSASPDGQQACVQYVQYCLQMTTKRSPIQTNPVTQAQTNVQTSQPQVGQTGTAGIDALIAQSHPSTQTDMNSLCQWNYGKGSYSVGGSTCGCISTYVWNSGKTACISQREQSVAQGTRGNPESESVNVTCNRMVMGQMTHFGTMTADACNTVWQAAVVAAQKSNAPTNITVAPKPEAKAPVFYVDTHPVAMTVTASAPATTTLQRRGFWSWFVRLLGL